MPCQGWTERAKDQPRGPQLLLPPEHGICQRCKDRLVVTEQEISSENVDEVPVRRPMEQMEYEGNGNDRRRPAGGLWERWCGGWASFCGAFGQVVKVVCTWIFTEEE